MVGQQASERSPEACRSAWQTASLRILTERFVDAAWTALPCRRRGAPSAKMVA